MKLANEISAVTGAGRGIGSEIVLEHARQGATVTLLARTAGEIQEVAVAITAEGGSARTYVVDVVDLDAVDGIFAEIEEHLGPVFAMDPGLVRTGMTEHQLQSAAGQRYLPGVENWFAQGINVPPTLAARFSVEIASGRFDRLAGRMLMAARGDLDLDEAGVERIVTDDLRSLRVNGIPAETLHRE